MRSAQVRVRRVMAMKLTPFEHYMLLDDRRSHPMTYMIRLEFSGRFHCDAFQAAVARAIQRHPLLRSHVVRMSVGGFRWVPAPDPLPYLDCAETSVPLP